MRKVELSDFFRGDFLRIVNSHKDRMQALLNEYDVVIFMARKAICFFDALLSNGEIALTDCHVISSRVIDYDGLERFQGKKIAVVDDVVVKGTSITWVAEKLIDSGVSADYYVIACEESFSNGFSKQNLTLSKTYAHFTQPDIFKLSGLIAQYIEASMRTFNVDFPIFSIKSNNSIIDNFLHENGPIDLTSGLQKKYGISNRDLYFRLNKVNVNDPVTEVIKKSIIKIRFYSKNGKMTAVPFVLLPECSTELLDQLFEPIRTETIDQLASCKELNIQNENKYKIVSYLMAMAMFCSFAKKNGIQYLNDEYSDIIQFDVPIGKVINDDQFNRLCNAFNNLEICNIDFSQLGFSQCIKGAYQYISSIDPASQPYKNWRGELIGLTDPYAYAQNENDKDDLSKIVFSFDELYRGLSKETINPQNDQRREYTSSVMDVFIDKGFVVPSIVHIGDNQILRAYKMGEFSKLTREQIRSFVRMIYLYQEIVKRNLDRTEFEKLCVLFFRKQINNHNFGEETSYDEGCYSIGYSYYGPRISNSKDMYTVPKDSALITDYLERDIVRSQYGKYYVATAPAAIDDFGLENSCKTFAYDYSELFRVFNTHPYRKNDNPWNQYIHTFDQYLTILAIGENKQNQILSLCAEIYLLLGLNEDMFFEEKGQLPLSRYSQILSGIDSGLWKYRCFREDALKKTTQQIIKFTPTGIIRGVFDVQTAYDRGDEIIDLRDKMGDFLFSAAYVINELLRLCERLEYFKINSFDSLGGTTDNDGDIKTIFTISNYYYLKEKRTAINNGIAEMIENKGLEQTVKHCFTHIIEEARYLLDICDLYLEKNSAYVQPVTEFVIAYSGNGGLPYQFIRSTECKISNLSETSKLAVFSIHNEQEINNIIDNLICDTQDTDDCYYVLVSSLRNENEGFIQFDKSGKGTNVTRKVKTLIKMINQLPDKSRRLFVLRRVDDNSQFETFNQTKVVRIEKSIFNSNNYTLDKYSIGRKKIMENKTTINNFSNISAGGHLAIGDGNIQQGSINSPTDEISKLIQAVLDASSELEPEQQQEAKEYVEVIQNEVSAEKPKKSMLKTALDGLKQIVTNEKFVDAVAKLAPVLLGLIK